MSLWCVHAINDKNINNVCMSHVHVLSTMTASTMYICPQYTCYQRREHQKCMYVWCVAAINDESTNSIMYVHSIHTINDDNTNNVCMSDVYMLSKMKATTIYVCLMYTCYQRWEQQRYMYVWCVHYIPMCTCYQRWEHQQCIYVWCVHANNDENTSNVCTYHVYMLSTMRVPTMYICLICTCYQRW